MSDRLPELSEQVVLVANRLAGLLSRHRLMLATAESCTGGLIAGALTEIAGSSQWFERGFVSYSNESKQDLLAVTPGCLRVHGAVSLETACEMAVGALRNSQAQISLAVTGVAGPGGGSPEKPVGTVCFAWAIDNVGVASESMRFDGDRAAVRLSTVVHALGRAYEFVDAAVKHEFPSHAG